jgi:hypothetical protein
MLLGFRRGLLHTLTQGIRTFGLGKSLTRLLFDRLLAVPPERQDAGAGGRVARAVERLPLAQAEQRLRGAVSGLVKAEPTGGGVSGWFRRRLEGALLGWVEAFTLARFREPDGGPDGVDLVKARADLESRVDGLMLGRLRGGLRLWTALVLAGLVAVVAAQTYVLGLLAARP